MAYEMCDLHTVKQLLWDWLCCAVHKWPWLGHIYGHRPVQSSEVMATGTRSICNILTQAPYAVYIGWGWRICICHARGCSTVNSISHSCGVLHPGMSSYKVSPSQKKQCIFGHCPSCDLTPLIAQIRALCGTMFLPKMRKFLKQQFWLWEWIFWQWLMSKMILRWILSEIKVNIGEIWWKLGGSVMGGASLRLKGMTELQKCRK